MTPIPTAIIGVNHPHVAEWHSVLPLVPELAPVAYDDSDPLAARRLLPAPYADLPLYSDLQELLAHHTVQAAIVLLPLDEAEQALLTLAQAGVHIFAEKPVVRTAAALRKVQAALSPGAVFYSGYTWRWDAIVSQIRSLVREGILGDLWSVEMRLVSSRVGRRPENPPHRNPEHYLFRREASRGGMLQWLGCHWIDIMLHVTGQPVTSVMAMTATQTSNEIEVEDTATCLLRFGNGMLGSLHTGYLLPSGQQACLALRGSLGWASWDWSDGRHFTVHSEHPSWAASPRRVFDFPPAQRSDYGAGTGAALLHDFARCITARGAEPAMTIGDCIGVLDILDAAYASAQSGKAVAVA